MNAQIEKTMNGDLDDKKKVDHTIKIIIRSYIFQYVKHIDIKFMENIIYNFANIYFNIYYHYSTDNIFDDRYIVRCVEQINYRLFPHNLDRGTSMDSSINHCPFWFFPHNIYIMTAFYCDYDNNDNESEDIIDKSIYKNKLVNIAKIKNEYPDIKLVILGDGKLRDYLLHLAVESALKVYSVWDQKSGESSNIEKIKDFDIYFLGFQENPFSILKRSSIFVLSSLWEGFPNVLLEAMAVGLPVLAADCQSGPREILSKDNYGILLPVLDNKYYSADELLTSEEKIWQAAIQEMLSNKKIHKEYAVKSKERAKDFDPQRIAAEWKEVFRTI